LRISRRRSCCRQRWWRTGGPHLAEHKELHLEDDEIVSLLAFHERGLRHLAHPFLLSLLNEREVELQHLHPNGVLHISVRASSG
jgi:hypothetical protein